MAKVSSKTVRSARASKVSKKVAPKARKVSRVVNPFVRTWKGDESKSAVLFAALSAKNGADLRDLAEKLDSNLATVRVRINQLSKDYTIEKLGGYGEPIYRLVA